MLFNYSTMPNLIANTKICRSIYIPKFASFISGCNQRIKNLMSLTCRKGAWLAAMLGLGECHASRSLVDTDAELIPSVTLYLHHNIMYIFHTSTWLEHNSLKRR